MLRVHDPDAGLPQPGDPFYEESLPFLAHRPGLLSLWRDLVYGALLVATMALGVFFTALAACCWFGVRLCEQVSEGCVYFVAWYECLQRWRGDSK